MDAISRSRGWDNEIPHSILPLEQLVLSDKWARKFYLTPVSARGKDKKKKKYRKPAAPWRRVDP